MLPYNQLSLAFRSELLSVSHPRQRMLQYNQLIEEKQTTDRESLVKELVLDFDDKTKTAILQVHPDLVAKLKPHQVTLLEQLWACPLQYELTFWFA
jgi:hypothetical protein